MDFFSTLLGKNHRAVFWGSWRSKKYVGPAGVPVTSLGATVVIGKTIEEACVTAFLLEREAEMQMFAAILGGKPDSHLEEETFTPEQIASRIEVQTTLLFPYFAAMDRGPRKETRGLLLWP